MVRLPTQISKLKIPCKLIGRKTATSANSADMFIFN